MPDMNPDQTVIPDGPYAGMNPTPSSVRAEGPYARMAGEVAKRGRYGDTMLMHVNPLEVEALSRAYPGMVTKNPDTGYPEAFWFLPAVIQALAAVGPTVAAGAATFLPQAVATGLGSVVGAIPTLASSALGGLSSALTAAGLPGMATAGKLTAAGIGKLGAALPTISGKIAAAGQTMAGGEGLAGALTSGAAKLGGLAGKGLAAPVNATAKVLGTGTTGGGGGGGAAAGVPPVTGAPPAAPPPAAPPPGDLGIGEIIAKTGKMSQTPAQLAADVIKGGGEVVKTGAQSQPLGQQILNMGGSAAKDLVTIGAKNIAPAATPWTTGQMLAGGLLGAQAIDAIIAATADEDEEDWKNAKSSYAGPSSWSGRTYTGGGGGGGTGEQSYYSSGRVG